LPWLGDPSWLTGVVSVADVFGTGTWYDHSRLTEFGSLRAMRTDYYYVAKDFWKAMSEEAAGEGLAAPGDDQIRLFDPDVLQER